VFTLHNCSPSRQNWNEIPVPVPIFSFNFHSNFLQFSSFFFFFYFFLVPVDTQYGKKDEEQVVGNPDNKQGQGGVWPELVSFFFSFLFFCGISCPKIYKFCAEFVLFSNIITVAPP